MIRGWGSGGRAAALPPRKCRGVWGGGSPPSLMRGGLGGRQPPSKIAKSENTFVAAMYGNPCVQTGHKSRCSTISILPGTQEANYIIISRLGLRIDGPPSLFLVSEPMNECHFSRKRIYIYIYIHVFISFIIHHTCVY